MNVNTMTIGEIAKVEELSGQSVTVMADDAQPKAKLMMAIAFVLLKRDNPKVKLAEVEAMTLDQINEVISFNEQV